MYQYTNKNGLNFGINHTKSSTMAYVNGNYIAQAETDKELEKLLDHFSHSDISKTTQYLGLDKEKATD